MSKNIIYFILFLSINCFGQIQSINVPLNLNSNKGIYFQENKGQMSSGVLYRMLGSESQVLFYKNKIQFIYFEKTKIKKPKQNPLSDLKTNSFEMLLNGSNPNTSIIGEDEVSSPFKYIGSGQTTAQKINQYKKIIYKNIYQNIDLIFYFNNENFKYDFYIHPGGNYKNIQIKYNGIDKIKVNQLGELVISKNKKQFKDDKPYSYQRSNKGINTVNFNYKIDSKTNTLSFETDAYLNHNQPIVIDPIMLDWSTYFYGKPRTFGGGWSWSYTWVNGMDIDKNYDVFLTGITYDRFKTPVVGYDTSLSSNYYDCYIAKLSSEGDSLIAFTYFGGSGYEFSSAITIDNNGDCILSGITSSSDFPITSNAYDKVFAGTGFYFGKSFISKLDKNLSTLKFSTFFGGTSANGSYTFTKIQSLSIDKSNDIYICGHTSTTNFPISTGAFQSTFGGGMVDGFISKLSSNGSNLLFSTYFGGNQNESIKDFFVTKDNEIFCIGHTSSTNFYITTGSPSVYNNALNGDIDAIVAKISKDGKKVIWSHQMGGSGSDRFESIFANENEEAFVGGISNSSDFYTTNGVFQKTNNGAYDQVIIKFNSAGTNVFFSTYLGSSGNDGSFYTTYPGYSNWEYQNYYWNSSSIKLAANVKDEVIIAGLTQGTNYPITSDAIQNKNNSKNAYWWSGNATIAKLNFDATKLLFGSYFGGSFYEFPGAVKVKKISCMSSILYGGITGSKDFPTTKGSYLDTARYFNGGYFYSGYASKFRDTLYTEKINFKDDFVDCDLPYEILDAKNKGADFLWNNGSKKQYLIADKPGTYWVRATYGCDTVSDTIRIKLEYSPKLALGNDTTICDQANYLLNAKNDTILRKYLWNNNDTTQTTKVTQNGLYWVKISTPNCGFIVDSIQIKTFDKPKIGNIKDSIFCDTVKWTYQIPNQSIGTKVFWSVNDTNFNININKIGNYFVTAKNPCGMDSVNFEFKKLNTPKVNFLPLDSTFCDTVDIKIAAKSLNNDETLNWNINNTISLYFPNDTAHFTLPGTYNLELKNKCGIFKSSAVLSKLYTPKLKLPNDTVYCNSVSKTLVIGKSNNLETYKWNNVLGSNNYIVNKAELITAEIKNKCGIVKDTINIYLKNKASIDLPKDSVFCNAINLILDATHSDNTVQYKWHDGSTNPKIQLLSEGKAKVQLTNQCGTVSDSMLLSIIKSPEINLGSDLKYCDFVTPISKNIGKSNNNEIYTWNNGSKLNEQILNTEGIYWAEITNQCGKAIDSILIQVFNSPEFKLPNDTSLCGNFNLLISSPINGKSYLWMPGNVNTKSIIAKLQTTYKLTVTDSNRCTGTDEFVILDDCKSFGFIPTSFSPNGDGINDVFKPDLINCESLEFSIFNRYGQLIFKTDEIGKPWDGTFKDVNCPIGSYVYLISYKNLESKTWKNASGSILLIK